MEGLDKDKVDIPSSRTEKTLPSLDRRKEGCK